MTLTAFLVTCAMYVVGLQFVSLCNSQNVLCDLPTVTFNVRLALTYTVFQKKTPTHIVGYKLSNSCLILIIFDIKIPDII